jgi:erythromycin esterase-like protein
MAPMKATEIELHQVIAGAALPLTGAASDFDPIVDAATSISFVLIGEASHGTHEFYHARAAITKRLIEEKDFNAVAIEGDWPDAYRVNRYVRGIGSDANAREALNGFRRFPHWMWRNSDVLAMVDWLRTFNDTTARSERHAGFYGLDLYSLDASRHAVLAYLSQVDTAAARRARERYACFDHFADDPQGYGHAAARDASSSCEDDAVRQLVDLQQRAAMLTHESPDDPDALFGAEQNARLVVNAEQYYREMFRGRVSSWNLRDSHMAETLEALAAHLEARTGRARIVVWAHNSHLGNARATEMGDQGEHNLGQLTRERHGDSAMLIGFTTYDGTVTAASDWDEPSERMNVRPARTDSYEALFHDAGAHNFMLDLRGKSDVSEALMTPRLERAIGVVYRPRTERMSHYFRAVLPEQFDFILHYDKTRALEPLERSALWERGGSDVPETYPTAL